MCFPLRCYCADGALCSHVDLQIVVPVVRRLRTPGTPSASLVQPAIMRVFLVIVVARGVHAAVRDPLRVLNADWLTLWSQQETSPEQNLFHARCDKGRVMWGTRHRCWRSLYTPSPPRDPLCFSLHSRPSECEFTKSQPEIRRMEISSPTPNSRRTAQMLPLFKWIWRLTQLYATTWYGRRTQSLPEDEMGVVYRIPCGECDAVYIGETGRPVQERMKEHERDVRLARCQTSAVAEHANATGHGPSWNDVKCIDRDPHWHTRRVKEAIQIRLHPNNINRDNGIEIPEAWMPTIRKHSWERSDVGTANHRATRSPNHNPAGAI